MEERIVWQLIFNSNQLAHQLVVVICLVLISLTHEFIIEENMIEEHSVAPYRNQTRQGRCKCIQWLVRHLRLQFCVFHSVGFPFYTIGRFPNSPCVGSNQLMGTCVLAGECTTAGGIATGSCNPLTRQAVCCVCKWIWRFKRCIPTADWAQIYFRNESFRSGNMRRFNVQ